MVTIQTSNRSKAWTVPSDQAEEQITVKGFNSYSPAPSCDRLALAETTQ
ncbi:MAG: hypothetical protein HWQ41_00640 [Nostoc sp. NOS(2021)]|nr:hypothetical protein [Nostoc sp. NOS(2021)]MBN3893850.1 hypothetical protein [Nostoc sp. NOS(2021)]